MATKPNADQSCTKLAAALGCKPQFVLARLKALGMTVPCGRCGGSGHFSYCPGHGTVCFGCNGSGQQSPPVTPGFVAAVREAVAAGRLAPYLESVALRTKARKAVDAAMAAWKATKVAPAYNASAMKPVQQPDGHWAYLQETNPRLFAANHAMCNLYDEASKLAQVLETGRWDAGSRHYVKPSVEEATAIARRLLAIPDEIKALDYDPATGSN
jgi:hypothetical protein